MGGGGGGGGTPYHLELRLYRAIISLVLYSVAKLVAESLVTDSQKAIARSFESSSPDDVQILTSSSPIFTPGLQCAAMLLNVSLRRLVLVLEEEKKKKGEESTTPTPSKKDSDLPEESKDLKVNFCWQILCTFCDHVNAPE